MIICNNYNVENHDINTDIIMEYFQFPYKGYKTIYVHDLIFDVERIEDKLKLTIQACFMKSGSIPWDFFLCNVQLPSQTIENIQMHNVTGEYWDIYDKDPDAPAYSMICRGETYIDLSGDPFFDREIIDERVKVNVSFSWNKDYERNFISESLPKLATFKNEMKDFKFDLFFNYSNTYILENDLIEIIYGMRWYDGKITKVKKYSLNISKPKYRSTLFNHILNINLDEYPNSYIRGYDLKLSSNNLKEIDIKNELNRKIETGPILFNEGYDYDIYKKELVPWSEIKGINYPLNNEIRVSGKYFLKINDVSFGLMINEKIDKKDSNFNLVNINKTEFNNLGDFNEI